MAVMGRPSHKPTPALRAEVVELAKVGIPKEQIAVLVGIAQETTLYKYYQKELLLGDALANKDIGGALYRKAMEGDVTCMIFWAKTRMKWREPNKVSDHIAEGTIKLEITRDIVDGATKKD